MDQNLFPNTISNSLSQMDVEDIQRAFITRVYAWMAFGLVVTAGAAYLTLATGLILTIVSSTFLFIGLIIGEFALVIALNGLLQRISPFLAGAVFTLYAALNGVTLSIIMLVYTDTSVALTFGITACTFGIMTLFGYTTGRDLTKLGSLLLMALIGVVIASVANIFLQTELLYWPITIIGILIFIGLVAYDTQKLKRMALTVSEDGGAAQKVSIIGALSLYLDFINLFLLLLRLFGKRRD